MKKGFNTNNISKPEEISINLKIDDTISETKDFKINELSLKTKPKLSELLKQYSCEKYNNGFSDLLESYLS